MQPDILPRYSLPAHVLSVLQLVNRVANPVPESVQKLGRLPRGPFGGGAGFT